eukprot:m.55841 g.55841  ORF g.55841 m.55841 type:complete len:322 (-) comp12975_c0_seq1:357-1322(-)
MQAINAKPIELFHNDGAKKVLAASPLLPFRGPHQLFMTAVAKRRNQQATQMKKPFLGSQIESGCHARKEQRRVLDKLLALQEGRAQDEGECAYETWTSYLELFRQRMATASDVRWHTHTCAPSKDAADKSSVIECLACAYKLYCHDTDQLLEELSQYFTEQTIQSQHNQEEDSEDTDDDEEEEEEDFDELDSTSQQWEVLFSMPHRMRREQLIQTLYSRHEQKKGLHPKAVWLMLKSCVNQLWLDARDVQREELKAILKAAQDLVSSPVALALLVNEMLVFGHHELLELAANLYGAHRLDEDACDLWADALEQELTKVEND